MANVMKCGIAGAMMMAGLVIGVGQAEAMPAAPSLSVAQPGTASIDQVRFGWRRGWRRGGARHIGHRGPRIGSFAR